MKIASFSTNGYPSNMKKYLSIFTHEQAKSFTDKGIEIEVFDLAPGAQYRFPKKETYDGVTVHRVPPIRLKLPKSSLNSIQYLVKETSNKGFSFALLSFLDSQYIKYLPWIQIKDLFFTVHGRDAMIPHSSFKNFIKKSVKKYLFKKSSGCFPVSEYTETLLSCLINRKDSYASKIKTIYNGVNFKRLGPFRNPDPDRKKEIRERFNLKDTFTVLSACQLVKRKGVLPLVEAILALLNEGQDIQHIIVGEGPEKEKILQRIKDANKEHCFIFLSNLQDKELAELYSVSSAYSMISKTLWDARATEGFGISYAEASFMGLPVICGKDGGSTLAVLNNVTGFWVDPSSSEAVKDIEKCILKLLRDRDTYNKMSANGIDYVTSTFNWDKNTSDIIEFASRISSK